MLKTATEQPILDLLINSIRDPLFAFNRHKEILVWNKAAVELTGRSAESVVGKVLNEVFEGCRQDKLENLFSYGSNRCQLQLNGRFFTITAERLHEDLYKASIFRAEQEVLNTIPPEYLVEFINASPISSIIFNLDGSILYSNNAYRQIWNLSDEDLHFVNNKYNLFLDKQLANQGLMPYIQKAFRGEVIKSPVFDYKFNSSSLGRDEQEVANKLIAHMYPIHNDIGDVIYIVLNFLDVTEQHNLQDAYRESRERLKLALKGGNLGTWDWNMVTGEMIYNERWASMLGYSLDEVHQITWQGLLHPDDKEECLNMMDDFVVSEIDEYEAEYRLMTKSGDYVWILDRGQIMERDGDGRPLRGVGTHMDITERKKNQEKIKESESKYRRLVENSPIGIAIVVEGTIQYINRELARIGKVNDPADVIGKEVKEFIVGEERFKVFKERGIANE